MAITWRELVGSPDSGAFRAMSSAGDAINSGFEALNRVLTQRQAANQIARDRGQDAQSVAFREALAGATTEDQVKAVQAQRDTMLSGLDPARRAALIGAEEARISSVRANKVAAQQFSDAQTIYDNRDLVNQAQALFAVGKGAEATALLEPIKHILPTYGDAIAKGTALVDARSKLESELKTATVTRDTSVSNAAANTMNAQTNAGQLKVAQQNSAQSGLQQLEAQRAALGQKLASVNQGTFGSDEGQKTYEGAIKIGAGDKAPTIMRLAGEALASNPKFRNLPTDVVTQIVLAHSADIGTGKWMPDLNVSSRIAADLEKAMGDKNVQAQMLRVETGRANLASQLQALSGMSEVAMGRAYPEMQAGLDAAAARAQARTAAAPAPVTNTPAAAPVAAPAPAQVPSGEPTVRLTSPPDSPAGRFQQRLFDEQQKLQGKEVQTRQGAQASANELIAKGDAAAAAAFQASPAFDLLDRTTKSQIYALVNGRPKAK